MLNLCFFSVAPVVIKCPILKDPNYGSVSQRESTAVYRCSMGKTLIGLVRRVCQSDGSWSGTEPTCSKFEIYLYYATLSKI